MQFGLAEIIPFSIDRFIRKADFSDISIKSVGHNFNPGSWAWDDDGFGTNQFAHPYHGSQYFSAYRANGYSFWQCVPAAVAGSYLWETVAEKQYPSPNDFINTSFGGIILGEMTYRLSNKIINSHTRGFKRQASEFLGLLINPMNGFTRILDGKWGKVTLNSKESDSSNISAEFDIGMRTIDTRYTGWFGHIKLLYGTPYENYKTPFSNISIDAEVGKDNSSKINILSVYGSLSGWRVRSSYALQHLIVLSANYDYIHNEAFFYSAQSIKFNLYSELGLSQKIKLTTAIGAGPIILGAVPDTYPFGIRDYDYGIGGGVHAGGGINLMNKFFYNLSYRGGWLKTINGNASHYFLHAVTSEFRYSFIDRFSICIEPGYFALHGHYRDHPNVNKNYPYLRISARYSVNIK